MSRGKYLSFEEARNAGKLAKFCKNHPSQADERFWLLLDAMARGLLEGGIRGQYIVSCVRPCRSGRPHKVGN